MLPLQAGVRWEAEVRTQARPGDTLARGLLSLVTVVGVIGFAGCSSGKPAYCADRTSLQNSVKGLTSLNANSGISGLKSQLSKIETNAGKVVSSAKSDFPSQTSAITSSVNALKSSVATLPPNASAAEIATVARSAASVVSSVQSFMSASNSKCS